MIHVEVTTPEGVMYKGAARSVSLPTPKGEITVLQHHVPLVTIVNPGTATLRKDDGDEYLAVTRGVVEIDGRSVHMLVQSADRIEAEEQATIEAAIKRAETLQKERRDDTEGFAEATAILERELAKLQTIRRRRSRRNSTLSE